MAEAEEHRSPEHADVAVLPPVLYLGALAAGVALQWLAPLRLPVSGAPRWSAGTALVIGGLAVGLAFSRTFRREDQDPNPNTPTPSLITTGLYRYSRNPAYVSLTAILLGIAVLLANLWIALSLIPVLAIMQWGVIRREERYLERKFGDEYLAYKASVRRWL